MPPRIPSLREPSLCLDVLVALLDLLPERSDVVALASTCKAMNSLGAKRILGFGVEIEDDDALVSFCRFMLADLDRRGPQLRKLAISIETDVLDRDEWGSSGLDSDDEEWETDIDPDPYDAEMETDSESEEEEGKTELDGPRLLARVLRGATRLEDLDIGCTEELMQRGGEELRLALTSLPALRRLRTATLGLGTLSVVRGMTAPLVEINLGFQYFNTVTFADMFDVLGLPAFWSTLEKITVWYVSLGGPDFVWHQLKDKPRFPRVHTLAVRCFDDGIYLPALVHAFPNLRTLDLTDIRPDGDVNVAAEHARNRNVFMGNSWRSLKTLCGDVDALYALALKCPVPRVDVGDVRLTDEGMMRLRSVIRGTRPSQLLLHVDQEMDSLEAYRTLQTLFDFPDARGITHLALDFNAASDAACNIMNVFGHGLEYSFLQPLSSLECLILRISDDALLETPEKGPSDLSEPPPSTLEMENWQILADHAQWVLGRRPSLTLMSFDLAVEGLGLPGTPHGFWKVRYTHPLPNKVDWSWIALPPETVTWWIANQGMQWHRRLEYAELPASC